MSDQVSHPYQTTGKTIRTYFIFTLPQIARRRVISFFPQILQFETSRISRMGNPCAVPVNMRQERVY
jgi:hypothetical protein